MLAIDVGPPEIIVLVLLIVLLFGAKKLPEIGRGVGKGIREFRDATKGIGDDVKSGMKGDDEKPPQAPAKDERSQGGPPPGP
jgi:sec-independent protein translocase protein TatA